MQQSFKYRKAEIEEVGSLPMTKVTGGPVTISGPVYVFGRGIRIFTVQTNALLAYLIDSWPRWYRIDVTPGFVVLLQGDEGFMLAETIGVTPNNSSERAYLRGGSQQVDRYSAISTSHAFSCYVLENQPNATFAVPAYESTESPINAGQYNAAIPLSPMPLSFAVPRHLPVAVAARQGYDAKQILRKPSSYRMGATAAFNPLGAVSGAHFFWGSDTNAGVAPDTYSMNANNGNWSLGVYISGTYAPSRAMVCSDTSSGVAETFPGTNWPDRYLSDATPVYLVIRLRRSDGGGLNPNDLCDLVVIGDIAALAPTDSAYNFTIVLTPEFFFDSNGQQLYATDSSPGNHAMGLYCPVQEIGSSYNGSAYAPDYTTRYGFAPYFGVYARWYLLNSYRRVGDPEATLSGRSVARPSLYGQGASAAGVNTGLNQ